mmetsp:Transcript_29165/g.73383  ORF Transcript_29165/g.73383 Transcript_29165/m.73383 type:complete len:246 (+) Transcript_29165:132-869(+)
MVPRTTFCKTSSRFGSSIRAFKTSHTVPSPETHTMARTLSKSRPLTIWAAWPAHRVSSTSTGILAQSTKRGLTFANSSRPCLCPDTGFTMKSIVPGPVKGRTVSAMRCSACWHRTASSLDAKPCASYTSCSAAPVSGAGGEGVVRVWIRIQWGLSRVMSSAPSVLRADSSALLGIPVICCFHSTTIRSTNTSSVLCCPLSLLGRFTLHSHRSGPFMAPASSLIARCLALLLVRCCPCPCPPPPCS